MAQYSGVGFTGTLMSELGSVLAQRSVEQARAEMLRTWPDLKGSRIMTDRDTGLLGTIIADRLKRSTVSSEVAKKIIDQMNHWPGLSSEEGWTIVVGILLAEKDRVTAQLAAAEQRVAELEAWQRDALLYLEEDENTEAISLKLSAGGAAEREAAPPDWVDWAQVRADCNWVAADGDGVVYCYKNKPVMGSVGWDSLGCHRIPGELPLGIDWRLSLHRRPA